jgi:hypothetical protein
MKRRLPFLAFTALAVMSIIGGALAFPSLASAKGAMHISGIAYWSQPGECTAPQGQGSSYSVHFTGSLKGCLYSFVVTSVCHPNGTYRETGTEVFVRDGSGNDTFRTTYVFKAKFLDCPNATGEIWGHCHHPIVGDSGTGYFENVSGVFNMKDDVVAGDFLYTGHLRWH